MDKTTINNVGDGARTTVSDLVGAPLMIPARTLELLDNQFISRTLLRDAGSNSNGLMGYRESDPLYLAQDVEAIAEFGEIPIGAGQRGTPRIAVATKTGLGIRVSREMVTDNKIDDVNRQIKQLTNTMKRADDRVIRRILTDPSIPTIAATAAWNAPGSKVRHDLAAAAEIVASSLPDDSQGEDFFGFDPDTVVMPRSIVPALQDNDEFNKVYSDGQAADNIAYSGQLPGDVLGMAALTSRFWPKDRVLVLERGTVGFYSETWPLEVTPLYGEGGGPNGGPTQSWRSDVTHRWGGGADQPKAACWITGVAAA